MDRQEQAKRNRDRTPAFVAWLGELRAVFGEGESVFYVREGDVELGRRFDDRLVDGRWPR